MSPVAHGLGLRAPAPDHQAPPVRVLVVLAPVAVAGAGHEGSYFTVGYAGARFCMQAMSRSRSAPLPPPSMY